MKVSDNVPNENENVTTRDQQTDQLSDQLLELPEWLFATKNFYHIYLHWREETGNKTTTTSFFPGPGGYEMYIRERLIMLRLR